MSYYIRRQCIKELLSFLEKPRTFKEIIGKLLPVGVGRKTINKILEDMVYAGTITRVEIQNITGSGTVPQWQVKK